MLRCVEGVGRDVAGGFLGAMGSRARRRLEAIAGDGAAWVDCQRRRWCRWARRVMDPFRLVRRANEGLDRARRTVWRQAKDAERAESGARRGEARSREIRAAVGLGLGNSACEAANSKIKLAIAQARGFRSFESLRAMVTLRCSSFTPSLPGRLPAGAGQC